MSRHEYFDDKETAKRRDEVILRMARSTAARDYFSSSLKKEKKSYLGSRGQ